MFEPDQLDGVRAEIKAQTERDRHLLDSLRSDARESLSPSKIIRPHLATAMSLVASDGGNNKLIFDPFKIQLVRVVDSIGRQMFLDIVSPTTDPDVLFEKHSQDEKDPLGVMMRDLEVSSLNELSTMIPTGERVRENPDDAPPGWVLTYRDICEWAVIYHRICYTDFGPNTILVRDGILRSKIFRGALFKKMGELIDARMTAVRPQKLYLVGIAKHSQVLARYRLAMLLENSLPTGEPRYVSVPRAIEKKVYDWEEYARGPEDEVEGGEEAKYVLGNMFLVRFGRSTGDPIWAVDIFHSQREKADEILGHLLADAIEGFPMPFYPMCLQQAHEHAQIVNFDLEILQDTVFDSVRDLVTDGEKAAFDQLLFAPDVANRRYE